MNIKRAHHIKYFQRCLQCLPSRYAGYDQQRVNILFFVLSGLESLDAVDKLDPNIKSQIIDWLYESVMNESKSGFLPSTSLNKLMKDSHITMTYCALICLLILDDDLKRLKPHRIIAALGDFQSETGAISATPEGETDLRFTFCAVAIYYILQGHKFPTEFSPDKAAEYIYQCQTYEGGFAQKPFLEAHGGSTFCAVSSLLLLKKEIPNKQKLIKWLCAKQDRLVDADFPASGFSGRSNKVPDSCYTFWIGSSLKMLNAEDLIDEEALENFLRDCQSDYGGFSKWRNMNTPDPLHSSLSLLGAGVFDFEWAEETFAPLSCSKRVYDKIQCLEFEELKLKEIKVKELSYRFEKEIMVSLAVGLLSWAVYISFSK